MQQVTVSGVPGFSAPGPEPLSAGLVLGVGRRDEGFVLGGITHLLEHLVMHELRRTSLDTDASVGVSSMEFTATGRPERVAEFLRRVCELLADPPVARIAVEAAVLRAEDAGSGPGPLAYAVGERYGSRGVGVIALPEPALLSLTGGQVRAWARRWATKANAALWLTGPVPEGMELPLPDGEPRPAPVGERARAQLPAWTEHPCDEVSVTAEVRPGAASQSALRLVRQRVEDELRHRRGLTYEVGLDAERIDEDRVHAGIVVEVRRGHELDAVLAMHGAIEQLAENGPDERELLEDREATQEFLADPRSVVEEVRSSAEAHVRGWSVRGREAMEEVRALTAEQVRAAARALRDTLLVGVPEDVRPDLPGVTRLPEWSLEQVSGSTYRRRLLGAAPRGARLVVGDAGVTLLLGPGQRSTVLWEEVLGLVEEEDGAHTLVGAAGWSVPVVPRDWRRGSEALAAVRARVPPELQVREDPQPDPD